MRVLKISFMVFILIGSFAAIQAGAEASNHHVISSPPSHHRVIASPHSVPSQRNLQSGTGKTVLPYPQGYTSRHNYPYHNNYYYPYRSFYSFGFGYYPYLSYGFWPWYYGGYYSPYYYSPYYGGGYSGGGYGYGYSPYRGGYNYGYGELRIQVKPKSAKVYVDGDYVGVVDDYDGWWQRLKLEPGKHRIVIREGGYVPYAQTVRILPGEDTHIKTLMQPGRDQINEDEMRLPPGERDRDRYGHDRYDRDHQYDRDRNPYGEDRYQDRDRDRDNDRDNDYYNDNDNDNNDHNDHSQMEMNHDGDHQSDRDRDYASNDQSRDQSRAQDNRNNRNFTVQVEPHDATIYIDGNYYGTADVNESGQVQALLPEGVHKVEVVRPGYESFSQEITVNDRDNKLVVRLHKK